jgi:hypothetical protein
VMETIAQQLAKIGTRDCRRFADKIFFRHGGIDKFLKVAYVRRARDQGFRAANIMLREVDERLRWAGGEASAVMDDEAIRNLAAVRAIQCEGSYKAAAKSEDLPDVTAKLQAFVESCGVPFPLTIRKNDSPETIRGKCLGAIARVSDARWWRRQLRTLTGRQVESELRGLGFVRKQKSPYVSNWALARWKASQRRNKTTMAGLEAVNEEGEAVSMDDCIAASVSNPVNRRNELMVRMRGYEEVAQGLGLVGLFFTLTCPSKFHAQQAGGGRNANYCGASPLGAMDHLNSTWAQIRAEWKRRGIRAFGFRVAEPHHDGTPHFHFLLFVSPEEQERACDIFGRYALSVDGSEPGALRNRWDVVSMDPAKGSAAGYIAKYVAKNLDGHAVGIDDEGECLAAEGSQRVRAWASLWGIRQFQPIGSVSVTVWRELRRRKGPLEDLEPMEVEPIRSAADRGEWREFVELMGGAFVGREGQTLRPAYFESASDMSSKYGEAVRRLIGVWLKPVAHAIARCIVPTREHVWRIQQRDLSRCIKGEAKPPPSDLCQ